MSARVADLEFTHPIAVYGGSGGGVAPMRAVRAPAADSYRSLARLSDAAPGLAAGYYLIRSRAVATYRGGWWASILLYAVPADADADAVERAAFDDPRLSAVGEFEAVLDDAVAREVQQEYDRSRSAQAAAPDPEDDPSALWARNERGDVFPVTISERPFPRFLPILLVRKEGVPGMPPSTVFYTEPFSTEHPEPSVQTAPVTVEVFQPKRRENESDLLADVVSGTRRPFARLVIGSRSAVRNEDAHD
jgi:hypothetical protein